MIIMLKLAVTNRRDSTLSYSILSWLWAVSSVGLLVARCVQRRLHGARDVQLGYCELRCSGKILSDTSTAILCAA